MNPIDYGRTQGVLYTPVYSLVSCGEVFCIHILVSFSPKVDTHFGVILVPGSTPFGVILILGVLFPPALLLSFTINSTCAG